MKTFWLMITSIVFPSRYKKILALSAGKAFFCVFLLTLVFGTVRFGVLFYQMRTPMAEMQKMYSDKMPYFKYTALDGLQFDAKMPFVWEDSGMIIIVDTRDDTDKILDKYLPKLDLVQKGALIGKRSIIHKKNIFTTETYTLSSMNEFAPFDKNDCAKYFPLWMVFMLILWPFYLGFFMASKLLSVLVVSLAGLIVNAAGKYRLTFGKLYTASAFALVLPVIADVSLNIAGFQNWKMFFAYYAVAILILIVGLKKGTSTAE
jgi:hypothetical protein